MDATIAFLLDSLKLKQMPRTGWLQRGVARAESVADHSYGVSLVALVLLELVDVKLNQAQVLKMALLHDLPEALTGDLPAPLKSLLPGDGAQLKKQLEFNALAAMLGSVTFRERWQTLWQEASDKLSSEAQLVADADKLDMLLQAYLYEQQSGNRLLDQFWRRAPQFYFSSAQALFERLSALRGADVKG